MLGEHEKAVAATNDGRSELEAINAAKDTYYNAVAVKYIDVIPDITFR